MSKVAMSKVENPYLVYEFIGWRGFKWRIAKKFSYEKRDEVDVAGFNDEAMARKVADFLNREDAK